MIVLEDSVFAGLSDVPVERLPYSSLVITSSKLTVWFDHIQIKGVTISEYMLNIRYSSSYLGAIQKTPQQL